jgi:hypothetical protein
MTSTSRRLHANVAQQTLTSRRKLQITLDVQIIDQTNGKTLWEKKGLRTEGEYAERDEPTVVARPSSAS